MQGLSVLPKRTQNEEWAAAVRESITRPLVEGDKEIGLGPEGPLLDALLRSVYSSALDLKGKATFTAAFDDKGRLTSLALLSTDSSRNMWEELSKQVKVDLGGKAGRPTPGGTVSTIEVTSELKLPSGSDPGLEMEMLGIKVKEGDGPKSAKMKILTPTCVQVPLDESENIKVPVCMMNVVALAGDLSDIGQHPQRVVHARVVLTPHDVDSATRERIQRKIENGGRLFKEYSPLKND
jgi:hypothetical protein